MTDLDAAEGRSVRQRKAKRLATVLDDDDDDEAAAEEEQEPGSGDYILLESATPTGARLELLNSCSTMMQRLDGSALVNRIALYKRKRKSAHPEVRNVHMYAPVCSCMLVFAPVLKVSHACSSVTIRSRPNLLLVVCTMCRSWS
jgi:hypothetical protein